MHGLDGDEEAISSHGQVFEPHHGAFFESSTQAGVRSVRTRENPKTRLSLAEVGGFDYNHWDGYMLMAVIVLVVTAFKFLQQRRQRKLTGSKNAAFIDEDDYFLGFENSRTHSQDANNNDYCQEDRGNLSSHRLNLNVGQYDLSISKLFKRRKTWSNEKVPASWLTRYTKDWMSRIDDNLKISEISLPGSHDTASKYGGFFVETQSWSLMDQLESGIRYFDIRCRCEGTKFSIHHGPFYQHLDFDQVLDNIRAFLKAHPTETLLMRVKEECEAKENSESFSYIWDRYMNELGYSHIMARSIDNSVPTLRSVRGKVVVLREENGIDSSYGLKYDQSGNSVMDVQDDYSLCAFSGISKKNRAIKEFIQKARKGCGTKLLINHCSGTRPPIYYPEFVAKRTNKAAFNEIGFSTDSKQCVGVIVMDFPGEELIRRIVLSNMTANEMTMVEV